MSQEEPERRRTHAFGAAWRALIGPPLRARDVAQEQITPVQGLSALSLDALTSVAYGPEAIIVVLATAGASALHLVLPITIVIVVLLAILVFSYCQVIDAYPGGGGAYAVSRDNFGAGASLVAAAALVVDYTLTVAVSIAAGCRRPHLGLPVLLLGHRAHLSGDPGRRHHPQPAGPGRAAHAFLLPTLIFIVGLLAIIAIGLIHPLNANGQLPGHSPCRPRA